MRFYGSFILLATITLVTVQSADAAWYSRGHAVNQLSLPTSGAEATSYAIDLNGDGIPENAFGSVIAALVSTADLDFNGATAAEVAAGQIVHLVELRTTDPAFANDATAEATWFVGLPTPAPPLFDGSDTFRFDPSLFPAGFVAALTVSSFVSDNPATTHTPVHMLVQLRIGNNTIILPLQGSRLKFSVTAGGLSLGQVNGSIQKSDIDNVFVPALAQYCNDVVQSDPTSDRALTLLDLFDTNPEDGFISVEEVANNPLFITLLAPDVDILDANDNYSPNPANTSKESLSFGFGFTAVVSNTLLERIFDNGFEP